jgi:hypothetical protein
MGLWVDEKHGVVVVGRTDTMTSKLTRHVIYDFERMEVNHVLVRPEHKSVYTSSISYGIITYITPRFFGLSSRNVAKIRQEHDDDTREIVNTMLNMWDEVFNKLFPLNDKIRVEIIRLSDNSGYNYLREFLVLMTYLVRYPHSVYLMNQIPNLLSKFTRTKYKSCYSGGNWAADDIFKLTELTPSDMTGLSQSIINVIKERFGSTPHASYIVNSAMILNEKFGTDVTIQVLNRHPGGTVSALANIVKRIGRHEKILKEWCRRLTKKEGDLIHLVHRNLQTLKDHCIMTPTTFLDLPFDKDVLKRIIDTHWQMAEEADRRRNAQQNAIRNEKLKQLAEEYNHLNFSIDGYEFVLLTTTKEFSTESKRMHNCVSGYSDGSNIVVSMRLNNKPVVNIQYDSERKRVLQKYQACNKPVTKEQDKIINKWLKQIR